MGVTLYLFGFLYFFEDFKLFADKFVLEGFGLKESISQAVVSTGLGQAIYEKECESALLKRSANRAISKLAWHHFMVEVATALAGFPLFFSFKFCYRLRLFSEQSLFSIKYRGFIQAFFEVL